jgi:hypothetical protein
MAQRQRRTDEVTPEWGLDLTEPELDIEMDAPAIRGEAEANRARVLRSAALPAAGGAPEGSMYELVKDRIMAERARRSDEGEGAIAAANQREGMVATSAQFGKGMSGAADLITGRKASTSHYDDSVRQAARGSEHAGSAYERVRARLLEERRAQQAGEQLRQGREMSDRDFAERQRQFDTSHEAQQRQHEADAARREQDRLWQEEQARLEREFREKENAKQRWAATQGRPSAAPGEAPGIRMPAGETVSIGDIDAATKVLDEVETALKDKASGPLAGAFQYLPGSSEKQYDDQRRSATQTIGVILGGGKMADRDFGRYYAMLPSPGDSKERAASKLANLRKLLQIKRESTLGALTDAGYNTSGLQPRGGVQAGGMVTVTNGSETLQISAADLPSAERDGYRRVN